MAEPTCPNCQASGMENFASQESQDTAKNGKPWFDVVYCAACGHVYGVFAKHVIGSANKGAKTFVIPD